jgi:hypothetical protein
MSRAAVEDRRPAEGRPTPLADLGDGSGASRAVLRIAWPAILENALHTLLGIVDTILVARLGTEAIAGVGAGVQWVFLFFSILFGLSSGAVVLVARSIGAGDVAAAGRAARQSLLSPARSGSPSRCSARCWPSRRSGSSAASRRSSRSGRASCASRRSAACRWRCR